MDVNDANLVDRLLESGRIEDDDVLALRRAVFPDGVVSISEAEAVFDLDQRCTEKCESWAHFYVEALTDFFVWQAEPRRYVSEEAARYLLNHILRDGAVDGLTELELLINVAHWAHSCPSSLTVVMLDAVKQSVLEPAEALYGHGRAPGHITESDVHLIRRAIYSGGGDGGYTVSRDEAEILFELNDRSDHEKNHPGWRDLFVKAVASHLMFPFGPPRIPSISEARHREAWLRQPAGGIRGMLSRIGKSLTHDPVAGLWNELDPLATGIDEQARARREAMERMAHRESIDEAEAKWLVARLEADRKLDANERALLVFIRRECPDIHPLVEALLEREQI